MVEWIARQPWSDGRVVMFGGSFVGMTQWHTAAQNPPHLAAIALVVLLVGGLGRQVVRPPAGLAGDRG